MPSQLQSNQQRNNQTERFQVYVDDSATKPSANVVVTRQSIRMPLRDITNIPNQRRNR